MKRSFLGFFALAGGLLQGQTTTIEGGSITAGELLSTAKASSYIVHYTTQEKCYECGMRLAVGCIPPGTDACRDAVVPSKTVGHFRTFATLREALVYINRGAKECPYWGSTAGVPKPEPNLPAGAEVVAVYRSIPLKLKKTDKILPPEPQSGKVVTTYEVAVP